jgi:hypothetical protein
LQKQKTTTTKRIMIKFDGKKSKDYEIFKKIKNRSQIK